MSASVPLRARFIVDCVYRRVGYMAVPERLSWMLPTVDTIASETFSAVRAPTQCGTQLIMSAMLPFFTWRYLTTLLAFASAFPVDVCR